MTTILFNAKLSRALCDLERSRLTKKFACVALRTFFGEYISLKNASINDLLDEYDGSIETIETIKIIDSFDTVVSVQYATMEDLDRLFKPVQKLVTKNSAVCSIAVKLSKHGIKNPMAIAWQVYRLAMSCLHSIAKKCYFDFYAYACELECILLQYRYTDISQVLPTGVCHVLKKHALSLTI